MLRPSIGTSANPLLAQTTPDMQFNKRGYIVVESEKTGRTTKKGVFAVRAILDNTDNDSRVP